MTGTGAGAIDLEWLMDNVRVAEIDLIRPMLWATNRSTNTAFASDTKPETQLDFLLARYRLYTNVYFHKTTRGIEQLISLLFRLVARSLLAEGRIEGLADDHPLVRSFSPDGDTIANYRAVDDTVMWGAIHILANSGSERVRDIAIRILHRRKPICLDVQHTFPEDFESQRRLKHDLSAKLRESLDETVLRDTAKLSLYGEIGADDGRAQKRLMIQMADQNLKEITDFKDATVAASDRQRSFERYYFLNEAGLPIGARCH